MLGNEYTKNEIEKRIKSAPSEYEHYKDLTIEGIVRELSDFSFLPKESFREYFDNKLLQELTSKVNEMIGNISNIESFQNDQLTKDYVRELKYETVRKWFDLGGDRNPSRSRADLFKLGFALGLNKDEFHEFCHKVFNQKYCINNPVEYCMVYCLKKGHGYVYALNLYAEAKGKPNQADSKDKDRDAEESCTTMRLLDELLQRDRENFIEYLAENMSSMTPSLDRINGCFEKICGNCFPSLDFMWDLYNLVIENKFELLVNEHKQKPRKLNAKSFEYYFFPKTDGLNDGQEKSDDQKDKDPKPYTKLYKEFVVTGNNTDNKSSSKAYQRARKRLITAHFIYYYVALLYKNEKKEVEEQNSSDYYSAYRNEIDRILEKLNLAPMYFLDPFDRLFMICAARENPIIDYYETLKTIAFPPTE